MNNKNINIEELNLEEMLEISGGQGEVVDIVKDLAMQRGYILHDGRVDARRLERTLSPEELERLRLALKKLPEIQDRRVLNPNGRPVLQ